MGVPTIAHIVFELRFVKLVGRAGEGGDQTSRGAAMTYIFYAALANH